MGKILIVDDEDGIRDIMKEILEDEGHIVSGAQDGQEALTLFQNDRWDLVFLDVWLPGIGGLEVLENLKRLNNEVPVIMISGHARIDQAVKAIKMGAFDFIEKPLSLDRIVVAAEKALEFRSLKRENQALKNILFVEDQIIGESAAMAKVLEKIEQAARVESRILILGENGTGKELVARAIHLKSARANFPFIEVNCAAIPDTLVESELFGHEKGAFTGAMNQRKGKWELANGGTLFLDEIGDLSLNAQAKVLRAVQEGQLIRVGGQEVIKVNVRIIAATNKNLLQEVKEGHFREDLYYRLDVLQVQVPPLRERSEDIPLIAEYFLEKFAAREKRPRLRLSSEAIKFMKEHTWPGNVRELKNVCERIAVCVDESPVSVESVKENLTRFIYNNNREQTLNFEGLTLNDAKNELERLMILDALHRFDGNLSKAAQHLGLYPSALHVKIKKFGIEKE